MNRYRADGGYRHHTVPDWHEIFPFTNAYDAQRDGIERALENGRSHGYTVIEGACGTGKTLLALTAGLTLTRDPDTDYNQVVAATSLRQQMRAFEADLKAINSHADTPSSPITPVTAVSLVGKADVCPYSTGGQFSDGDVYQRCTPLRQSTRKLVYEAGDSRSSTTSDNPVRNAMELVADAHTKTSEPTVLEDAVSDFAEHPFEKADTSYCPYYAQHLADDIADESSIPTTDRVLTRDRLMTDAVEYGTCPHTTMRDAMYDADVVLANYQHIFNPQIVDTFSEPLVTEDTFLIVDEAHTLLAQVREDLSADTSHTTLVEAAAECRQALEWLTDSRSRYRNRAEAILEDSDVTSDEIRAFRDLLDAVAEKVADDAQTRIDDEHPDATPPHFGIDEVAVGFDDPSLDTPDTLTTWSRNAGFDDALWRRAEAIGGVLADIKATINRELENMTGRGTKYADAAGTFLTEWATQDHTAYYRELRVTDRGTRNDEYTGWKATLRAELWLNNLIPASELASKLDAFGGGILMSATLAPLDIYCQNAGLNYLIDRPVDTAIYDLSFPSENRLSLAVDLPPFEYKNRGDPFSQPDDPDDAERVQRVRGQYLDAMAAVCQTTPGNVLLYLPSYAEADWAVTELEHRLEKPVLCDESSGNIATDELKAEFFDGPPKVLATSLRGTLTEGVDFSGDRLAAAVVIGVPIIPYTSPRKQALLEAYQAEYGYDSGFEYAFTVPAVRKARQAVGRVIRGTDDVGVRVFLDRRYTPQARDTREVHSLIPDVVTDEYQHISPEALDDELAAFWSTR
jgi:DNA excision repair protein ERCC-2